MRKHGLGRVDGKVANPSTRPTNRGNDTTSDSPAEPGTRQRQARHHQSDTQERHRCVTRTERHDGVSHRHERRRHHRSIRCGRAVRLGPGASPSAGHLHAALTVGLTAAETPREGQPRVRTSRDDHRRSGGRDCADTRAMGTGAVETRTPPVPRVGAGRRGPLRTGVARAVARTDTGRPAQYASAARYDLRARDTSLVGINFASPDFDPGAKFLVVDVVLRTHSHQLLRRHVPRSACVCFESERQRSRYRHWVDGEGVVAVR